MSPLRNWLCLCSAFTLLLASPEGARAQVGSSYPSEPTPAQPAYPPQDTAPSTPPEPSPLPPVDPYADPRMAEPPPSNTVPASPDPAAMPRVDNPPQTSDVPRADAPDLRGGQSPLTQDGTPASLTPSASPPPYVDSGAILDGRQRLGPFLSGPGSFRFIAHHTALGALGGFFTQAFANDFSFDQSSREAMLAGTLIGAGLGFGASSWWQFNNWVDKPMSSFTIINSGVGGAFMAGFMDLFTQDAGVLTWSAFLGAELGAWLTAGLGGGQLPLNDGLLISSGAGWGAAYAALLLAVIHFSGTDISSKTWRDTLLLAPGIGAGALALATMRYNPTPSQILRADLFGAGVGAAVLLI
ncbi:hypothetical protein ACN47A_32450, partial [Myxococcus fulvus]|uniref:hypothetical protein n=1 Tax=Myxococcus fulvus TaxID=33 RepID=UPI003B9C7F99